MQNEKEDTSLMDQEKVNRTDEMEIDLRELFYLFRQKLLIIKLIILHC